MKLACKNCGNQTDFQDREIRLVAVEQGDEQLFQIRAQQGGEVQNHIFRCEKCGSVRATILGEATSDWAKEGFVSVKIFTDPTPNGQINSRVMNIVTNLLEATDLDEQKKENLLKIVVLCAKKLVAVWKHMQAYGEIEDSLIEAAERTPSQAEPAIVRLEVAQDLLIELDEFLVQLKSSLDYLVKVTGPILGLSVQTFGDKGDRIIQALRNNVPDDKKKGSEAIIHLIIKQHQPWLTDVINARDKLNHLIGEPIEQEEFMVFKRIKDGAEVIHRPRWSPDQTVRVFMDVTWQNLLCLFEDFIVMLIGLRLKQGLCLFRGSVPEGSSRSPWGVTTETVMREVTAGPGWQPLQF